MLKYIVSLILLVLFGTWSLLNAIFCAWLTATPVTPDRLRSAQIFFYVWLAAFAAASIICFVIALRMTRLHRSQRTLETTRAA
jgi:hypothetical protein